MKRAILHRKNSLFYRTASGAAVGDLYMALIATAKLAKADPFDCLNGPAPSTGQKHQVLHACRRHTAY